MPQFDHDFHQALEAAYTYDIAPLDALLERWRRIATVRANPLTPAEHEQVRRFHAGDDTGLWEQAEDGTFHRIG